MKNKTQLSVRPVRKSKKPGYPSWQEPNPLEQPYAQPYPFTQKAINWLAASGLCGALFLMPEAEGIAKQVDGVEAVELDTLGNPFPFEKMGLPHVTSPYGTGLPVRLKAENARRMIGSLFLANGYKLEKKVIQAGEGLLELDGYDEGNKIGYVYLPAYRLDKDLFISWVDYDWEKNEPLTRVRRYGDEILEEYNYSIWGLYDRYKGCYTKTKDQSGFLEFIKELVAKKNYDWKDEYRFKFYEFLLRDMIRDGSYSRLPYKLRLFYDHVLAMPEGPAKQIELDKAMSVQDVFKLRDEWAIDALILAANHEKFKVRLKEFQTLQTAYMIYVRTMPERSEYLKETMIKSGKGWVKANSKAKKWVDEYKVSMAEIIALLNESNIGKRYVAVISEFRANATETGFDNNWWSRAFKEYQQQYPQADSTEFVKSLEDNPEPPFFRYAKERAMADLEKQVLDYILWARQQRGY